MINKLHSYNIIIPLLLLVVFVCLLVGIPIDAFAADGTTCTDSGSLVDDAGTFSDDIFGMIEDVITDINQDLLAAMYKLYGGIILWPGYRSALMAAITLMISFYGISFMFGIVPATFAQLLVRLLKISVLFWMITPNGFAVFFGATLVQFFYIGVQCLIVDVVTVGIVNLGLATGDITAAGAIIAAQATCRLSGFLGGLFGGSAGPVITAVLTQFGPGGDAIVVAPLIIFKSVMNMIFSPRMFVIAFATFTTGPYGPIMGMAFLWSIWQLLQAILKGIQIYMLSLIVRAILLGLAPIFLPFMLFERTKSLFMGWVNQLVSFSLQPVMLFAFLSFFSILILSAANDMAPKNEVEVCYTKTSSVGELPFDIQKWSFKVDGQMYDGEWTTKGCTIPAGATGANPCDEPFPIEIINILIFLVLTYIAVQMVDVVVGVASQIAQGSIRLTDTVNATNSWFSGSRGGGGSSASAARARSLARK